MTITNRSAAYQARTKLLQRGPASLSDAELLSMLLRRGTSAKSAIRLAQEVLQASGGLRTLLQTSVEEFTRHEGLGIASYTCLQTVMELASRQLREALEGTDPLTSPDLTRSYLQARLRDRSREIFAAMFLDNRHRVRVFEELFKGTLDGAAVYPRVVAEKGLRYRAAAVIVAHNHPSGVAEPSQADVALTRRLKDALALVDIRLLDHFIIGDGAPVSMAERGLI